MHTVTRMKTGQRRFSSLAELSTMHSFDQENGSIPAIRDAPYRESQHVTLLHKAGGWFLPRD